jgi:hypothetical protein
MSPEPESASPSDVQEGYEAWARHEKLKETNRRQARGCLVATVVIFLMMAVIGGIWGAIQ